MRARRRLAVVAGAAALVALPWPAYAYWGPDTATVKGAATGAATLPSPTLSCANQAGNRSVVVTFAISPVLATTPATYLDYTAAVSGTTTSVGVTEDTGPAQSATVTITSGQAGGNGTKAVSVVGTLTTTSWSSTPATLQIRKQGNSVTCA